MSHFLPRLHAILRQGLLGVAAVLFLAIPAGWTLPAPTDGEQRLSQLEQELFSVNYPQDSIPQRLTRLEETVLGESHPTVPVPERIAILGKFMAQNKTIPASRRLEPSATSASSPQAKVTAPVFPTEEEEDDISASLPVTEESDYPLVNQMEEKALGKVYAQEPLPKRLSRLETQAIGAPQSGTLMDRVDGLRGIILGEKAQPTVAEGPRIVIPRPPQYHHGYPPAEQSPATALQQTPSDDLLAAVTQMEKDILRKTYPQEPLPSRLSRMEVKIFHSPAPPSLSSDERVQRLLAVANAGGSGSSELTQAGGTMKSILPFLIMLIPMLL